MAAYDGAGERRRTRSLDDRKRIVVEALAPGAAAIRIRCGGANRLLKKSVAWGRSREHNGIQRSPERNRTAAEMSLWNGPPLLPAS